MKRKEEKEEVDKKEIKEMNNWLHRIQQNVESLEKRLDAIERRLSKEPFENPGLMVRKELKNEMIKQDSAEIKNLIQKINALENEIKELRKEKPENKPIISIKRGENKNYDNEILNIERRLEKLERRKATVKVGKIEVPIEITGLVGGLLAFLIAILLWEGYKKLVISPLFVGFVGLVLLLATGAKTYIINATKK